MDGIEHDKRKWYVVRDTLAVTECLTDTPMRILVHW